MRCHVSTTGKKLVEQHYLLHLTNMVNFGPLPAEIVLPVWGTPANFNEFRVLPSLRPNSITLSGWKLVRSWSQICRELKFGLLSSLLAAN